MPSSVIMGGMKARALWIITLFALLGWGHDLPFPATAQARPAVHHELELHLMPTQGRLQAKQRITLPAGGTSLRLFIGPQVHIQSLTLEGSPLEFSFGRGLLDVRLPRGLRGSPITLELLYAGQFADSVPQAPINNEDPTYGVAATITEQGTFLSGGSGWYADPRLDNATWSVKVTAPPGYLAVTAGRLVEQITTEGLSRSHWVVETPLSNLTLSAGPYILRQTEVGGIALMAYFYAHSQDLVASYLEASRDYLGLYQKLFGPYPFEKFAIVENFFPTGYGFPSWTLLGSTVVRLPFILETSLGHEIAHSWWGTGVRVDFREGNWSEGLTTYVADYLFQERRSAESARDYRLKILRDYASLVNADNDFALNRFVRRDSRPGQAIGYGKAAMVFHMVRRQIGDEAFWQSLRHIAETRMFEQVGWSYFAETFSRLSGQDLQPLFNQWLQRPGAPILKLEEVHSAPQDGQWIVYGRMAQQQPRFRLTVPLHLETENYNLITDLLLSDRTTRFEITASAQPRRLVVDPDAHVFRHLFPEEIPASVNNIRGSQSLIAVVSAGLSQDTAAAARLLLQALRQERTQVIQEKDFSPDQHRDQDVLFFGLPANHSEPLQGAASLAVGAEHLEFGGQIYTGSDTALFAVVAAPGGPETSWAYFIPLSAQAAQDAARRIPHYGRYSYLVFHQGANRDKGIWDIQDSPLIHNFRE